MEHRPLLRPSIERRSKISYEVKVTGIIIVSFILVITLLLLLQNLRSSSTARSTTDLFALLQEKVADHKNSQNGVSPEKRRQYHKTGCPLEKYLSDQPQNFLQIECALLAEKIRLQLRKCVNTSLLPNPCQWEKESNCASDQYRSLDGSCNNLQHPQWGRSETAYMRMILPDYADGTSSIRMSKDGSKLPNTRFLSQYLYSVKKKPDSDVSYIFLNFGLLLDHDIVETAVNTGISCCNVTLPNNHSKECFPIEVSKDDSFYGSRNVNCLNLVRSTPVYGECVGRREQLNRATQFLDGSAIYGSTTQKMALLRSFAKGELRTQKINNTPYMVFSEKTGVSCGTPAEPLNCFEAGDSRVNMLVELTAMHTLWYREHNRIAQQLFKFHSDWSDENLFQEARKIVVAQLQHITYNEFLPVLLGEKAMNHFHLTIDKNSTGYHGYDDTVNPGVFNAFATAAFRFGHALTQDTITLMSADNQPKENIFLHETFFNPQLLYHNGLDLLLRGAANQRLHSVSTFISKEVREHLFQDPGKDFGHDLAAIGIQRGRDHGLPAYPKWRSSCGLSEVNSWKDLNSIMSAEDAQNLEQVYKFVDDIDLIPAALAETPVAQSLLGPTYLCIIGRQFQKTMKGDRFWFEIQNRTSSFTTDQLKEIYNSNMARIVCDNSDNILKIQTYPFKVPSANNPSINCNEIPRVNLSMWNYQD